MCLPGIEPKIDSMQKLSVFRFWCWKCTCEGSGLSREELKERKKNQALSPVARLKGILKNGYYREVGIAWVSPGWI